MENLSGLVPKGKAVLLVPYEPEIKKSMIVLTEGAKTQGVMLEQRAIVLAIGPDAWKGETPRAELGDKVLVSRFAGYVAKGPADGKDYRIINCNDIFAQIVKEKENG